ncbi:hypothetical protein WKH57_01115 [Niallia taxi]|uniref:hypothetical protein n=1 Tax=Niallia taxi TaxID=2499688 RepID=UPI003179CBF2
MKIINIEGNFLNWDNVNNIEPWKNRSTNKYGIKVHMVNGSGFGTDEIYDFEEAKNLINSKLSELNNGYIEF